MPIRPNGSLPVRAVVVTAALALLAGALAPPAGARVRKKDKELEVAFTSAGCPRSVSTKAGPTTFVVTNDGADNVSEFEILKDDRILGEVENVVPGLTREFTLTLKEGTYVTYCPGGDDRERGRLVVKGATRTAPDPQAEAAVAQYRAYITDQATQLVALTTGFVDAVKSGDVGAAKAAYAAARVPYERIEPVAETFGDLDPDIDAREGDVPDNEWGGYHRIEKALWIDGSTSGMATVADDLLADVQRLQSLLPDVELEPATIANGAVELLNEVSASKITGEEERYSRTDLVDFEANVQGAQAAYDAVKPILLARKAALVDRIDPAFAAVEAALAPYRRDGGFVPYTDLTAADTRALSLAIDTLAEPLSQVARVVAGRS